MLVTHQLQYLHDVNNIVIMNMGQLQTQGKFEYIKNALNNFDDFHQSETQSHEQPPQSNEQISKVC